MVLFGFYKYIINVFIENKTNQMVHKEKSLSANQNRTSSLSRARVFFWLKIEDKKKKKKKKSGKKAF